MNDKLLKLFKEFSYYAKGGHVRHCWEIADDIQSILKREIPGFQDAEVLHRGLPVFTFVAESNPKAWLDALREKTTERIDWQRVDDWMTVYCIGDCAAVRALIRERLAMLDSTKFRFC